MQQSRGVQEFDRRANPDVPVAGILRKFGRCDRQHGPQAFAAGIDEVVRQLGDHFDAGNRLVEDDAIDRLHILMHKPGERLEALARIPDFPEWDDYTQGKFLFWGAVTTPSTGDAIALRGMAEEGTLPHGIPGKLVDQGHMQELVLTDDIVLVSYLEALLSEAGIDITVLDRNVSALGGAAGRVPQRILVPDHRLAQARALLIEAGLEKWITGLESGR